MARRKIDGSRIILTGSSSGIGRHLAKQLSGAGASLVLVARRKEMLEELATELRGENHLVETVVGDVTDMAVRQQALERATSAFGGLDILINNAGVSAYGRFANAKEPRFRRIMEVNFFAPAEFIREAIPLLREGYQPMIVNVGSILGYRAIPYNSEYSASKFALRGLSESLRSELSPLGIDVLLVSPGKTDTEFSEHLVEKLEDLPWHPHKGVLPQVVARATLRAIRRGRREIIPSRSGRLLVGLNRIVPGLIDRVMRRYG